VKLSSHLVAWINHAALNFGSALRCLWHVVLPPQVDHTRQDVEFLAKSRPHLEFLYGCGVSDRPESAPEPRT
jgi:hypothetical protein